MDGLEITRDGAILKAEFFIGSGICLCQKKLNGPSPKDLYEALKDHDNIRKKLTLNRGDILVGELDAILIDEKLNPSLNYRPVEWIDGKKQYRKSEELPLEVNDKHTWFELMLNPDARKSRFGRFYLYMPNRFYLDKQI